MAIQGHYRECVSIFLARRSCLLRRSTSLAAPASPAGHCLRMRETRVAETRASRGGGRCCRQSRCLATRSRVSSSCVACGHALLRQASSLRLPSVLQQTNIHAHSFLDSSTRDARSWLLSSRLLLEKRNACSAVGLQSSIAILLLRLPSSRRLPSRPSAHTSSLSLFLFPSFCS